MKKFFAIIPIVAALCISCNKDDSNINTQTPENPPEIAPENPSYEVLSADEQRERFKKTANALMDQVDVNDFKPFEQSVKDLVSLDWNAYENSQGVRDIVDIIDKMTTVEGRVTNTVLKLTELKGNYTVKGGDVVRTESDGITVSVEDRWLIKVTFSQQTRKILVSSARMLNNPIEGEEVVEEENIYVDLPLEASVSYADKGQEMAKIVYSVDFNITTYEHFSPATDYFWGSISANVSGYQVAIHQFGLKDNTVALKTSISKGEKTLVTEVCEVKDVAFDEEGVPSGAGKATLNVDVMGEIQVKAETGSVTNIIELGESLGSEDETSIKNAAKSMNEELVNGVYFGTDVRQSHIEIDVFKTEDGRSYASPVFVLDDGTRFDDPAGFFTEEYFSSVVQRFNTLIENFSNLIPL